MVSNNGASHQTPVSFAPSDSIPASDLFWQQLAEGPLEDTLNHPPPSSERKKNRPVWTSTRRMPLPVLRCYMRIYSEMYNQDGIDLTAVQCMVTGKGAAVLRSWPEFKRVASKRSTEAWAGHRMPYEVPHSIGLLETLSVSMATYSSSKDLMRELDGVYGIGITHVVVLCTIAGLATARTDIVREADRVLLQKELTSFHSTLYFLLDGVLPPI